MKKIIDWILSLFKQEELEVIVEAPVPVKKKPAAKKTQSKTEKVQCEGKTGKGVQCKKMALPGCTCCAVHIPKLPVIVEHEEGFDANVTNSDGPVVIKKKKKVEKPSMSEGVKASKSVKPVHNHSMDEDDHDDCPACMSHGNSTKKIPKFGVKEGLQDRLSAILNSIDDDETDDDGEASVGDADDE
jgi:hypothetical protein